MNQLIFRSVFFSSNFILVLAIATIGIALWLVNMMKKCKKENRKCFERQSQLIIIVQTMLSILK
jgi:hypothetical protein